MWSNYWNSNNSNETLNWIVFRVLACPLGNHNSFQSTAKWIIFWRNEDKSSTGQLCLHLICHAFTPVADDDSQLGSWPETLQHFHHHHHDWPWHLWCLLQPVRREDKVQEWSLWQLRQTKQPVTCNGWVPLATSLKANKEAAEKLKKYFENSLNNVCTTASYLQHY